jgi:hypothetical protein
MVLSPAAQVVLTAATQKLYCLDPEDVPMSASEYGSAIAAALRAAADEVVPMGYEDIWTDGRMLQYEKQDPVRDKLFAIANELEAMF